MKQTLTTKIDRESRITPQRSWSPDGLRMKLPKLAVLAYPIGEFVDSESLVLEAYDALTQGRIITTVPAPVLGCDRHCWFNVENLIEERGGELVMGWGICDDQETLIPQHNRFARIALNCHAIWLHDGIYYETTPERLGCRFIIAELPELPLTVEFYDYESDAHRLLKRELITTMTLEGVPLVNVFISLR